MRLWGYGAAPRAFARARAASDYARRSGCGIDEADEIVSHVSRRRFLQGAGALVSAAALGNLAEAAAFADTGRRKSSTPKILVVGSGMAGLGCAYKLWTDYGIHSQVYEYNTVPGGRVRTLRGFFADDQIAEEHAEFINPEHTMTLALAKSFGLAFDDCDTYPEGTHPHRETLSFFGKPWSQKALNEDWHKWAWKFFRDAARDAKWPVLYDNHSQLAKKWDFMSVPEWIDAYLPGGIESDFGALCMSAILDEYGGPPEETSALNLVYLLGQDSSTKSGLQPKKTPVLGGGDEKWHIRGGNDQVITGMIDRLPSGTVNLGQKLVSLRSSGIGNGYVCSFETGSTTHDVSADQVVLALPFTTLRLVDLKGVEDVISPLHMQAIREEPLGSNSKFFVQCTSRVWNDPDHTTGNAYCGGIVQGAWDETLHQKGKAGILVALPGGTLCNDWGQRFGLTDYMGTPPAGMLHAYVDQFNRLFPGVSAAYNGRSYYVWSPGDPHILGAYSYLKVGQFTAFNGIQGRQEGNLHFAGEQTSVNFQGYMEGALRSGYRCAEEIATNVA